MRDPGGRCQVEVSYDLVTPKVIPPVGRSSGRPVCHGQQQPLRITFDHVSAYAVSSGNTVVSSEHWSNRRCYLDVEPLTGGGRPEGLGIFPVVGHDLNLLQPVRARHGRDYFVRHIRSRLNRHSYSITGFFMPDLNFPTHRILLRRNKHVTAEQSDSRSPVPEADQLSHASPIRAWPFD